MHGRNITGTYTSKHPTNPDTSTVVCLSPEPFFAEGLSSSAIMLA